MTDRFDSRKRESSSAPRRRPRYPGERFTLQSKLVGLALALAISACLVAVASRDTNAYFADANAGAFAGKLGSSPAECPYRLQPGTSKARRWDLKDGQSARVQPIAQNDSTGTLFLDFGEEVPQNSCASPDVFRVVSLVAEPRAVSFSVSGAVAAFVVEIRLKDRTSMLEGGATGSVYVKIRVPGDAQPGTYTGTLTVRVDGWTPDAHMLMTITVRDSSPGGEPAATPAAEPEPAPTITPSGDPAVTPSPTPTVAPSEDPAITPPTTPSATPSAAPTASPALTPETTGAGERSGV